MQVFPDGIHRPLFRFFDEPGHERFLRFLLLPLGTEGQGRTVLRRGQRQQTREEGQRLRLRETIRAEGLAELHDLVFRRILRAKLEDLAETVNDGTERAVLRIGRALKRERDSVVVVFDLSAQFTRQTGFADTRLAAQQHGLPRARLGLLPALE